MTLIDVYRKTIEFLNGKKFDYIVIGGFAAGIIGEPRATVDIDIDIILDKKNITQFLNEAKNAGFEFSEKECKKRAKQTGTFQVKLADYRIDFIITSIALEKEAIKRKEILNVHKVKANFPTPEDLILLKIIPGRPRDIVDAENVAIRHSDKLDKRYLLKWAERLSDEAEDMRIYKEVKRLIRL